MAMQKTIGKEVSYSGVALHTGSFTTLVFKPAPVNSGIVFVRKDIPNSKPVKASAENVIAVVRGTSIGVGDVKIHTVEHVLAALAGFEIDNATIEIDAAEPPVGDGSSLPYMNMVKEAGVVEQTEQKRCFAVQEPLWVTEGDNTIIALPSDEFKISCTIAFNHKCLKSQYLSTKITPEIFEKQIATSRTFCFYNEVEALMDKGLIKGGSLDNAVVIGENGVFSKEELRFEDEFVRHKILDLVGDLYLFGGPIKAHIVAIKSGHAVNVKFVKALMAAVPPKTDVIAKSKKPAKLPIPFDINKIKQILPHRYPFLLVDRIIETDNESRIVGLKNLTVNEEFFNGHFPGNPVMPGVLQLEAMAQCAGVLMLKKRENEGKNAYFMAMENVKFRKPVIPGDQLLIEVQVLKMKSKIGKVSAKTYVDGEVASEADLTFAFVE